MRACDVPSPVCQSTVMMVVLVQAPNERIKVRIKRTTSCSKSVNNNIEHNSQVKAGDKRDPEATEELGLSFPLFVGEKSEVWPRTQKDHT